MSRFKSVFFFVAIALGLVSCEKDYSDENQLVLVGDAVYTFSGGTGNCTSPVINGTYMAGLVLTAANTVQISVDVAEPGDYSITTNTTNGISFSASGTLDNTGLQIITLIASGTPTSSGTYSFQPNSNGCIFPLTVLPAAPPAVCTLAGAPGNCAPITVNGVYEVGSALGAGNTAQIQVDVTTAGSYSVVTPSLNGVIFSASGLFTTTGPQTVTLTGTGTPTASGTFSYSPTINTVSTCTFTVLVAANATDYIRCKVAGVDKTFNISTDADTAFLANVPPLPDVFTLNILGSASSTSIEAISLGVTKPAPYFAAGNSFDLNGITNSIIITSTYTDAVGLTYNAISGLSTGPFTIGITSISPTRIQGTFSGTLGDILGGTNNINITNGEFSLTLH